MAQKQTRSRSKSASRKSKTENVNTNNPIVTSRRKSTKLDEDKSDKDIDKSFNTYRRITRQAIRETACTSLDDWKLDEPFVSNDEDSKVKSNVTSIKESCNVQRKFCQYTWFKAIGKALFSFLFILVFPVLIIFLNKMCENGGRLRLISFTEIKLEYFTNCTVIVIVFTWLLFLSFLSVLPIGSSRSVSLSDGFQLRYRCNGILSLIISILGLVWLLYSKKLSAKLIYDNYYLLVGSSISLSLIISALVLLKSYLSKTDLVIHPGNVPFCFLMGRENNPRILGLDLKYFYEFRPGLISWALLNIIFCAKDWEENDYKSINWSLLLCAVCQLIYCFDSLLFEGDVILKSFMVSGRFGFIHCFGSQVIVPFLFTITSRTIQINKLKLCSSCLGFVVFLNIIGFVIYRSANSQKNDFRRNPYSVHMSHLKTITTENGQQLLAGGWWGLLRHPNYAGDIVMSICWSLYAGSCVATCWFYPLYFTIFIVNRCLHDERCCAQKHGEAWIEYKHMVRHRIVPFIF